MFQVQAPKNLGKKVAEGLNAETVQLNVKAFPDGEYSLRFEDDLTDKEVVVVQTTGKPQDTNIMQLLLTLDAVKDLGAKKNNCSCSVFGFCPTRQTFLGRRRSQQQNYNQN